MLSPLRSLPRLTLPRPTSRHLSTSPTALRPRSSVPSAKRPTPPPSPQPPPTPAPTSSSPRQPSHPRPWERPEPPLVAAARAKSVKQRNVWESYLVLDPKLRLYFSLGLGLFALIGLYAGDWLVPEGEDEGLGVMVVEHEGK